MPSQRTPKIDLNRDYPCPCRRRGTLQPIVLTEALGCNRCQQIFVARESGTGIEQLSAAYPYKRSWRWTGHRWVPANSGWRESYLLAALASVVLMLVVWLPLALRSPAAHLIFWVIAAVSLAIVPVLMLWLSYRR